jgi:malate dehydrogenase (oxaloacetate-decarboxylating)(NADP+)
VCNPEDDPRFRQYWETYHQLMKRKGATPEVAKAAVRRSNTIIASLMVKLGDADAMICGLVGTYETTWSASTASWAMPPAPPTTPR